MRFFQLVKVQNFGKKESHRAVYQEQNICILLKLFFGHLMQDQCCILLPATTVDQTSQLAISDYCANLIYDTQVCSIPGELSFEFLVELAGKQVVKS